MSLLLVFSLLILFVNLYAKERRGAEILIMKKEGRFIGGELIAVKQNSLLLWDAEGKDMSVGIEEIKVIRVVKKSKCGTGAGIGALIGAGFGTITGTSVDNTSSFGPIATEVVLIRGIYYWLIVGLLVGGTLGLASGTDEIIQIKSRPPSVIESYLDKLRKKARVRDYK